MAVQDLICWCCGGVALLLLAAFASFGEVDPPASVELLLTGEDSAIGTAGQRLVGTAEDWEALWARHVGPDAGARGAPPMPEVDFDTHLVVAVFVGRGMTAHGLALDSFTSEDDTLAIRYAVRSYQTSVLGTPDATGVELEMRYDHIRPYGFFLLSRSDREIVLLQDTRGMAQPEPVWTERARFAPPAR